MTRSIVLALVLVSIASAANAADPEAVPPVKSMRLDASGKDYLPLLHGPPETVTMRSGLVVLAPGRSVGRHRYVVADTTTPRAGDAPKTGAH